MFFYLLLWNPSGDAETSFSKEAGYNQGDTECCPICGETVGMLSWLPPFRVEVELYGRDFGDFAFGHGGNDFLVSQKFREGYNHSGLTGLLGFDPVEVIKVKSRSRRKITSLPPMYFRVNPQRGATALDMAASGFEWVDPPTCGQCRVGNVKRWKRLVLEAGTWTGEDCFRPRGTNEILVTQRFKDTCERHGITNAVFIPAEEAGRDFYAGEKPQNGKA